MAQRLYRSSHNKVLGGVCGGIGDYLGIDPVVIRIIFILLSIGGQNLGVILYILLWILLPVEGAAESAGSTAGGRLAEGVRGVGDDIRKAAQTPNPRAGIWFGVGLIIVGAFLMLETFAREFGIYWLNWLNSGNLWALLLVVIGVAFLMRGLNRGEK
jgi:phage shock protein C